MIKKKKNAFLGHTHIGVKRIFVILGEGGGCIVSLILQSGINDSK